MSDPRKNKLYSRDCKLCGVPLAILSTGEGKMVGLDLSAAVYAPTAKGQCVRTDLSLVDHMATCMKLDRSSEAAPERRER